MKYLIILALLSTSTLNAVLITNETKDEIIISDIQYNDSDRITSDIELESKKSRDLGADVESFMVQHGETKILIDDFDKDEKITIKKYLVIESNFSSKKKIKC
jgi:hypothetical protein